MTIVWTFIKIEVTVQSNVRRDHVPSETNIQLSAE